MLMWTKNAFKCVKSDLILFYIWVNQNHALNTIIYTMSNEIVFKQKLFAKNKAKVRLTKQLIYERIICTNKLVLDILQDTSYVCKRENFILAFVLHFFILFFIKSAVFHWWHLVIVA